RSLLSRPSAIRRCRALQMTSGSTPASPAAESPPPVLISRQGRAGLIQLNRPRALNALTLPMLTETLQALHRWQSGRCRPDAVDLIIIKGCTRSGSTRRPVFCAGGDVRAVAAAARLSRSRRRQLHLATAGLDQQVDNNCGSNPSEFFRVEFQLNHAIGLSALNLSQLPPGWSPYQPFVALMDGIVMGGGAGVSVNGSHRVATEHTLFAMPEAAIGFFPDVGGGHFLGRLPGELGTFLALTGHRLAGRDVRACGIATHFVRSDLLSELEDRLCHGCWPSGSGPDSHSRVSAILDEFESRSSDSGSRSSSSARDSAAGWSLSPHLAEIDAHFSRCSVSEILSSLAAAAPSSQFAANQLSAMRAASPTSLAVSLRQIRRCRRLGDSLARVLRLEYRLAVRLVDGNEQDGEGDGDSGDFLEGVRAALDDKGRGQPPKWRPASVAEITEAQLEKYFRPLPPGQELTFALPSDGLCGGDALEIDADCDIAPAEQQLLGDGRGADGGRL
uniref:3-hydroxyisobutyryl-CoA hydrolase, mitochondrial n=1 Tax=Macrostomum lignano TaxID=282301 RepID=A0A1I8G6T9_9PLAT